MKKTILVACGTGIATSTVAAKKIKGILKDKGYDVETVQCKALEAASKAKTLKPSFVVGTCDMPGTFDIPVLNGRCLLTGVGLDAFKEELVEQMEK